MLHGPYAKPICFNPSPSGKKSLGMIGGKFHSRKNIGSKNSRNTSSEYLRRTSKALHLILSDAISTPDAMLNK